MNDAVSSRRKAALKTPSGLSEQATRDIAGALTMLLADVFALYLKTKNFHWHVSGPHFRDYHLMLDDQGDQNLCYDGSDGGAGPQGRRNHASIDRPDCQVAAHSRQ